MTAEEVASLWKAYAQNKQSSLRNLLVEAYLPLAGKLAGKYASRGMEYEDLFQVASLSLIRTVENYRLDSGNTFVSYAVPCIEGALRNEIRDRGSLIRLPGGQQEKQQAIIREIAKFERENYRSPSPQELAEALHMDPAEVLLLSSLQYVSLDACLQEEENLYEYVGQTDENYDRLEDEAWLKAVTEALPPQEKTLIQLRYIRNLNQRETAKIMGISQMQVSRLEKRLLRKLREMESKGV